MNTIKIKIGDIEYTIKQSFRALMTFEKLTGKSVQELNETIEDVTTLFYAVLQANNRQTFKYTFDEFIDLLDEQADIFTVFTDFLQEQAAKIVADEVKKK